MSRESTVSLRSRPRLFVAATFLDMAAAAFLSFVSLDFARGVFCLTKMLLHLMCDRGALGGRRLLRGGGGGVEAVDDEPRSSMSDWFVIGGTLNRFASMLCGTVSFILRGVWWCSIGEVSSATG